MSDHNAGPWAPEEDGQLRSMAAAGESAAAIAKLLKRKVLSVRGRASTLKIKLARSPLGPTVEGKIRWLPESWKCGMPIRGFGFIADSAGGPDVFLHISALQNAASIRTILEKATAWHSKLKAHAYGKTKACNVQRTGWRPRNDDAHSI
jgi:cold shock CspA family protein